MESLFWRYASSVFLENKNASWTFAQVLHEAKKIATKLQTLELKTKSRILLRFWNDQNFVFAYFGCLLANLVVVTVSPLLTIAELNTIIKHSGAALALSFEPLKTNDLACPLITLNDLFDLKRDLVFSKTSSDEEIPVDLKVIIYTSGTTSAPKGVMLGQQNILAQIKSASLALGLQKQDCFIGTLSFSHVFGQMDILWTALWNGCCIQLLPQFEARTALEIIQSKNISILIAVPTMYQLLLRSLNRSKNKMTFANLRVCHSGAAPMPASLSRQIYAAFGIPLQEGYGLTETCSMAFSNPLQGPFRALSVGKPIQGVECKLVDENGQQINKCNEIGEVCIKGPIVTSGYFAAPDLTKQAFDTHGFLQTGDLGYVDEEGDLFLVDRKKDLIIQSGLKVYPREIEEVLLRDPLVFQVAVVGLDNPDSIRGQRVKAFVVLQNEANKDHHKIECKLRELCKQHLAQYKIPHEFEFVESIPQTASGKLMKRKLVHGN